MQPLPLLGLIAVTALGCGEPRWDTERWHFELTSRCDETDGSTNPYLCFNAGLGAAEVQAACDYLCRPVATDGRNVCTSWTCKCTPTKGKGPCSCEDATRTLDQGC